MVTYAACASSSWSSRMSGRVLAKKRAGHQTHWLALRSKAWGHRHRQHERAFRLLHGVALVAGHCVRTSPYPIPPIVRVLRPDGLGFALRDFRPGGNVDSYSSSLEG